MTSQTIEIPSGEERKLYPLVSLYPTPIRKRIKALKKLQLQASKLQASFFREVHRLECWYLGLSREILASREGIVAGRLEPEDADLSDSPDEDPEMVKLRGRLSIARELAAGASGIPEFWLTALKNSSVTRHMVCPHDEPALRHLADIRVTAREADPMSFTLNFHFSPNPFFSNRLLTKEYVIKCEVEETSPWEFVGPEIVAVTGCWIDWLEGMDLTQKIVQERQRLAGGTPQQRAQLRSVIRRVKDESFFNFFSPPGMKDADLRTLSFLNLDFEVGSFIREKLIPRAVLYFTGEAFDGESSSSSESSETSN